MARKLAAAPRLTRADLNRATLARQMLLERSDRPVVAAVEALVSMQAQLARPPFMGLWSRLSGFRREDLVGAVRDRQLVRATMMRCTLFLMSARDYLAFRTAMQPVLTNAMRGVLKDRVANIDLVGLVAPAREYFGAEPRTFDEYRNHLLAADPGVEERVMGYAVRTHLPLIQVPDGGPWGYPSAADFTPVESWLGEAPETGDRTEDLVLRYLAAYGPASAADFQNWSGLQGAKAVLESLRPRLTAFLDEAGRELFDLPDAPRPDADAPAPVRFLPEFDNVVMAHADRSRIIADEDRPRIFKANLRVLPTLLVDGMVAGTWTVERKKKVATLVIEPFRELAGAVRDEVASEGRRLVEFVEPDAPQIDFRFG